MVKGVKVFSVIQDLFVAILCINDTANVRVDILVVSSNRDDNWMFVKVSFQTITKILRFDFDVGGLGGRVLAVCRRSILWS